MKHMDLEFTCWHENGIMYNDFGNGVMIQHHIAAKKTAIIIDGDVKTTYEDLTIAEFMQKQVDTADIARKRGGDNGTN